MSPWLLWPRPYVALASITLSFFALAFMASALCRLGFCRLSLSSPWPLVALAFLSPHSLGQAKKLLFLFTCQIRQLRLSQSQKSEPQLFFAHDEKDILVRLT
jgi:hypothetical protein